VHCLYIFVYRGFALCPPSSLLDHLRSLNQSVRIGHLLCRSRDPDYLVEIIGRQVSSSSISDPDVSSGSREPDYPVEIIGRQVSSCSRDPDCLRLVVVEGPRLSGRNIRPTG